MEVQRIKIKAKLIHSNNLPCKMRALLFTVVFIQVIAAFQCQILPKEIKKCHFSDSQCIVEIMNDVIRRYPKGLSEIGMKPIDSLDIKDTEMVAGGRGGISVQVNFTKQVNLGFENTTITKVEGFDKNPTAKKMKIYGRIPSLIHKGNYHAVGKMWVLPINGSGIATSDLQNVRFSIKLKVIPEYRNNKRYLKIYELVPTLNLDRWILWLDKLFKENTDLTIEINQLINKNWVQLWNELEVKFLETFAFVCKSVIQDIFNNISYDDMFLPDEK